MQRNIAMKYAVAYMWPESSSVNSVNLMKKYYNCRDIEFFLGDYYFLARPVYEVSIFAAVVNKRRLRGRTACVASLPICPASVQTYE